MHGRVLGLRVSKETTLICFVNRVKVVVIAEHPEHVEFYGSETSHVRKA